MERHLYVSPHLILFPLSSEASLILTFLWIISRPCVSYLHCKRAIHTQTQGLLHFIKILSIVYFIHTLYNLIEFSQVFLRLMHVGESQDSVYIQITLTSSIFSTSSLLLNATFILIIQKFTLCFWHFPEPHMDTYNCLLDPSLWMCKKLFKLKFNFEFLMTFQIYSSLSISYFCKW